MPIKDGVGYSRSTRIKISHLEKILGMHLCVTQNVLDKHRQFRRVYRYIDLTSGKGINPDGTRGSPLVFLEQVESGQVGLPYRADFIERNATNLADLHQTVSRQIDACGWHNGVIHYHHGDYQQLVTELLPDMDEGEFGLVYVDPSGDLPDFKALQYAATYRPKMEILIRVASTNVKRQFQYTHEQLSGYIGRVGKRYWLCGTPMLGDQHKWVFLLGSNTGVFKDYAGIGLYRMDSPKGKEVFLRVNLTKEQQREVMQPKLPWD
jgi:three-Cys-motif partner protein